MSTTKGADDMESQRIRSCHPHSEAIINTELTRKPWGGREDNIDSGRRERNQERKW